jgi:hypothetical protein
MEEMYKKKMRGLQRTEVEERRKIMRSRKHELIEVRGEENK